MRREGARKRLLAALPAAPHPRAALPHPRAAPTLRASSSYPQSTGVGPTSPSLVCDAYACAIHKAAGSFGALASEINCADFHNADVYQVRSRGGRGGVPTRKQLRTSRDLPPAQHLRPLATSPRGMCRRGPHDPVRAAARRSIPPQRACPSSERAPPTASAPPYPPPAATANSRVRTASACPRAARLRRTRTWLSTARRSPSPTQSPRRAEGDAARLGGQRLPPCPCLRTSYEAQRFGACVHIRSARASPGSCACGVRAPHRHAPRLARVARSPRRPSSREEALGVAREHARLADVAEA